MSATSIEVLHCASCGAALPAGPLDQGLACTYCGAVNRRPERSFQMLADTVRHVAKPSPRPSRGVMPFVEAGVWLPFFVFAWLVEGRPGVLSGVVGALVGALVVAKVQRGLRAILAHALGGTLFALGLWFDGPVGGFAGSLLAGFANGFVAEHPELAPWLLGPFALYAPLSIFLGPIPAFAGYVAVALLGLVVRDLHNRHRLRAERPAAAAALRRTSLDDPGVL